MAETLRFRCPQCTRALAAPISVVGKKIGCPFCSSIYEVSWVIDTQKEPEAPASQAAPDSSVDEPRNSITKWIPSSVIAAGGKAGNIAGTLATAARSHAATGIQLAQSAGNAGLGMAKSAATVVGETVSTTSKKAVVAAAPLAQHAAAVASVLVPGAGEFLTGNVTQGACTFAAFSGALTTAVMLAPLLPAAPGVAVVMAVPVGIQVFSAWQGAKKGKEAGDALRTMAQDSLTTDEANRLAEKMRSAAEEMSPEEFERLVIEHEERELSTVNAGKYRVMLKKVQA